MFPMITAGLTGGWSDRRAAKRREGGTDGLTFSMSRLLATKKLTGIWTYPSLHFALIHADRKYDIDGISRS